MGPGGACAGSVGVAIPVSVLMSSSTTKWKITRGGSEVFGYKCGV